MDIYIKVERRKSGTRLRLLRRERGGKAETIPNDLIAALNQLLLARTITLEEALESAKPERDRLKDRVDIRTHLGEVNFKIYTDFWNTEYAERPNIEIRAAQDRVKRAFKVVKNIPLTSAATVELQAAINTNCTTNGQRREAVSVLRSVLQSIGRMDVRLRAPKPDHVNPYYITLEDFLTVLATFEGHTKLVVAVAFATGARLGEVFAIKKIVRAKRAVYLETQIDRYLEERATKNRRKRWVKGINELWRYVEAWGAVSEEERLPLRNVRWATIVTAACAAKFPGNPEKHLVFHDLRHCYAIHCLSKGMTLEQVAKALGDSIVVVQEYYTGFVFTLDDLDNFAV